jgi:hypothetical protein
MKAPRMKHIHTLMFLFIAFFISAGGSYAADQSAWKASPQSIQKPVSYTQQTLPTI